MIKVFSVFSLILLIINILCIRQENWHKYILHLLSVGVLRGFHSVLCSKSFLHDGNNPDVLKSSTEYAELFLLPYY